MLRALCTCARACARATADICKVCPSVTDKLRCCELYTSVALRKCSAQVFSASCSAGACALSKNCSKHNNKLCALPALRRPWFGLAAHASAETGRQANNARHHAALLPGARRRTPSSSSSLLSRRTSMARRRGSQGRQGREYCLGPGDSGRDWVRRPGWTPLPWRGSRRP